MGIHIRCKARALSLDKNSNNVVFGTNMELTSQYDGVIDELIIFNMVLSAEEVKIQYTNLLQSSRLEGNTPKKEAFSRNKNRYLSIFYLRL